MKNKHRNKWSCRWTGNRKSRQGQHRRKGQKGVWVQKGVIHCRVGKMSEYYNYFGTRVTVRRDWGKVRPLKGDARTEGP